jgi:DNA-binding transcriptional MerR regulator
LSNELSIGDLVSRTGIAEPTLRMWERRHRFPQPTRSPSGHRRYTVEHVEQVQRVIAGRSAGLSLPAAIERALQGEAPQHLSVFAALRRRQPELQPVLLRKSAMIALSRAIEDESLARAERQVLFGCFQLERFYRQGEARWRELSGHAVTAVFADFGAPADPEHGPAEIPIADIPSLKREWAIVCYGERSAVCLAGREPASSSTATAPAARVFETIWTVDPVAIRDLARACARAASAVVPEIGERAAEILALEAATSAEEQLRLATAVINRTLSRLP